MTGPGANDEGATDDARLPSPDSFDDPGPTRAVLARRVLGFDEALSNRVVSSVIRLPFGLARLTSELPLVYSLNAIQVDRPVSPAELLVGVKQHMADLPNLSVWTTQASVAWSLGPALADAGWTLERFVYMAHDGRTAPRVSPVGFAAVDVARYADFAARMVAEAPWGSIPGVVQQMASKDQRLQDRLHAEFVLNQTGDAGCHVYRHGTIAQIASVNVLADARGQGLGTGLMAAAMDRARDADLVFVIADADDWPRRWYARLGFRPVASGWEWNLRRDGDAATA